MSIALAPRPANETRRAQAVISTGLIDNPEPELFQIYCDLAKDISGFDKAKFSLFDLERQCGIADKGFEETQVGRKNDRDEFNVCSYVLLDANPLIMEDVSKNPIWKNHPKVLDGTATLGYAGFPVINKDNYALGTLCMMNQSPKTLDNNQVDLIKKITANVAILLDLRIEQKHVTTQKLIDAISNFTQFRSEMNIHDLLAFMSVSSDLKVDDKDAVRLLSFGLFVKKDEGVELSEEGRNLLDKMNLRTKPMKKIQIRGAQAQNLLDEMFAELN